MTLTAVPTLAHGRYASPVGTIHVLAGPAGLRGVGWRSAPRGVPSAPDETVALVLHQLAEYFEGRREAFDVPLDLPRMAPQTAAVLAALQTIAHGETITYAELARRSGTGLPPRAIGSIMGANPVPVVIPCHRVVASDGLGGFSGGDPGAELATKRWMLEGEGALPPALF